MCQLLEKEVKCVFDDAYLKAFEILKEKLISKPIIIGLNLVEPFEVMHNASGTTLGVVFCQKRNKMFHLIYFLLSP